MLEATKSEITLEILLRYYDMGFKLVPLKQDGKPAIDSWTPIYDNPNYWTPESLREHLDDFKYGVATTFGLTRLKDKNGNDLFLHCLDIDSEHVYNSLVMNLDR